MLGGYKMKRYDFINKATKRVCDYVGASSVGDVLTTDVSNKGLAALALWGVLGVGPVGCATSSILGQRVPSGYNLVMKDGVPSLVKDEYMIQLLR